MKRFILCACLGLGLAVVVGCASTMENVYEANMIYRVDSARILHIKKISRGLTIEGPRVGEINSGSATLGTEDVHIFAGTFPLSATDAYLYEQMDKLGANMSNIEAGARGGTRVRIDGRKYLGPEHPPDDE